MRQGDERRSSRHGLLWLHAAPRVRLWWCEPACVGPYVVTCAHVALASSTRFQTFMTGTEQTRTFVGRAIKATDR
jgi:hypothetical protein